LIDTEKSEIGLHLDNQIGKNSLFRIAPNPDGIDGVKEKDKQRNQKHLVERP
jgi:hypothetical protein